MVYLIANSFYMDFELVQADNKETVIDYLKSEGEKSDGIEILGSSEDMETDEAISQVEETIFISDLY